MGIELAAHCRRRMVANLARTSPVLVSVPPQERATLVERFETRIFEKGDKLVSEGEEAQGLHLVASGEVAVVAHEGGEPMVLATLPPGETVGEVALVLRRKANADVIAVHPTVTLFLPREEFLSLVQDHPGHPARPLHDAPCAATTRRRARSTRPPPRWPTTTSSCKPALDRA